MIDSKDQSMELSKRTIRPRWDLPIPAYDLHESNNNLVLIILEILKLDSEKITNLTVCLSDR